MDRIAKPALFSLLINMVFALYNIIFGVITYSWWLLTLGVYYAILSTVRFAVLKTKRSNGFVTRFSGIMLMLLSVPLVGIVILAVARDRGIVMHEIIMITMAAYSFTKITLAIINVIKVKSSSSAKLVALRNIALSEAFVSIFALQRSMLVSFGDMSETDIRIFNIALGSAVCIIVFLLGLNLVMRKKILFNNLDGQETDEVA